jgi:predicted ribosome quality control (RQC) complex YloA/Tae2 family protein
MPMIWDSPLTAAVARELDERLAGTRLRGHSFRWEERELTLFFRGSTLRWFLHPRSGGLTLGPPEDPPEDARPLAADLESVDAPPDERLIRFRFRRIRGRSRVVQVVVELMTNQWNALMVEGEQAWIRHVLWTREGEGRSLKVGGAYRSPDPSRRAGIAEPLSEASWQRLMRSRDRVGGSNTLLESVAFTSTLNLPALLLGPPEGGSPSGAQRSDYGLWLRLRSLDPMAPCILDTPGGAQPYPIPLRTYPHHRHRTILDAFRASVPGDPSSAGPEKDTLRRVEALIRQARARTRGIQREMDQTQDPHACRERANLLLARLGEVRKGARHVTLRGFHGEEVTLELDPALSPHENADALFQEAARRERAMKKLPPLLDKVNARIEKLGRLKEDLLAHRITVEEAERQIPSTPARARWTGTRSGPRLPFKRFRSSGGLEIRVGRGPRENDELTFRHSSPDDIWLHARETSGAHVVLRWSREDNPPSRDLTEAAVLAALHSGGRTSRVVAVDWTRRKHVRKPRKSPPGTVAPQRTRTLFVEPEPDLADRLSWER